MGVECAISSAQPTPPSYSVDEIQSDIACKLLSTSTEGLMARPGCLHNKAGRMTSNSELQAAKLRALLT